jgi:hypothetical protein
MDTEIDVDRLVARLRHVLQGPAAFAFDGDYQCYRGALLKSLRAWNLGVEDSDFQDKENPMKSHGSFGTLSVMVPVKSRVTGRRAIFAIHGDVQSITPLEALDELASFVTFEPDGGQLLEAAVVTDNGDGLKWAFHGPEPRARYSMAPVKEHVLEAAKEYQRVKKESDFERRDGMAAAASVEKGKAVAELVRSGELRQILLDMVGNHCFSASVAYSAAVRQDGVTLGRAGFSEPAEPAEPFWTDNYGREFMTVGDINNQHLLGIEAYLMERLQKARPGHGAGHRLKLTVVMREALERGIGGSAS